MSDTEEIFEKPKAVKKPKKVLSEAQKAALAKGRAKMAEKRAAKENKVSEKSSVSQKKEARKDKRSKVKEQDLLQGLLEKETKAKKMDRWDTMKMSMLGKVSDSKTFQKLQSILEDVNEEDIMDDQKLEKKLLSKYNTLLKESSVETLD